VIKSLHINFAKYEFAPKTFTEVKFPKATHVNWRVTAYSENTPFYTYLMNEEKFNEAKPMNNFGAEFQLGYGSSSSGSKGYDGKETKYLVFFNPSDSYVITNFVVSDAGSIGNYFENMSSWTKMMLGGVGFLSILASALAITKGISWFLNKPAVVPTTDGKPQEQTQPTTRTKEITIKPKVN
jgi:hypothetical protein